ncbi:LPXTG cell wall anchor domain-containing protein [Streptomyces sp. NPDC004830]
MTAPVVLLSAAPALAAEKPAARTQESKPTLEELRQAVELAQKEYDTAVIAVRGAITFLEEGLEEETYPTKAAVIETKKAAEAAAKAKTEADQAVADAKAELDAATTDEDKATAQTALDEAEKAAREAAEAKTAADTKAAEARTAHDDARVAQARKIGLLQKARDEAEKKLADAKKALADAKDEEQPDAGCVPEPRLTAGLTGLPEKVVGGTTHTFRLHLTNGTGKKMDEVYPYAAVHAFDAKGLEKLDRHLELEWSTAADPRWRDLDLLDATPVGSLEPKASLDVRLRLKVDADVPAGQGAVYVSAQYADEDGSCGGYPDLDQHDFRIVAKAGTSGTGGGTGKSGGDQAPQGGTGGTTQQGGSSTTPVTTTGGSATGSLAATGSSDALPTVALGAGAALVLGAGAVFAVRRRTTAPDA